MTTSVPVISTAHLEEGISIPSYFPYYGQMSLKQMKPWPNQNGKLLAQTYAKM